MDVIKKSKQPHSKFTKLATGIRGFDVITTGGLPKHRVTLLTGGPGCGKTLFGMEFLVKGIREFDQAGVFVSFEEKKEDLFENMESLGFELNKLIAKKKLYIEHIRVSKNKIQESGKYNLEGFFIRLKQAINKV